MNSKNRVVAKPESVERRPYVFDFSNLRLRTIVCELRYPDSYLVYDRTGSFSHELRKDFPELRATNVQAQASVFQSSNYTFGFEIAQARISSDAKEENIEVFAKDASAFFHIVFKQLELKVFTRIGLRLLWVQWFDSPSEPYAALADMNLSNLPSGMKFNAAEHPKEWSERWQSDQIGTWVRLAAETGFIEAELPPELQQPESKITRKLNSLTLDVDYYTVAPVQRDQWEASAWIPQAVHVIKKECKRLLAK